MRPFWAEVFTASEAGESAYQFFLIAVAHIVLGAAGAEVLGLAVWFAVLVYLAAQLWVDWKSRRTRWDSVADTLFVAGGAALPIWLDLPPFLFSDILAVSFVATAIRAWVVR